jgi:4'-phosphopantetheinyl transferase
MTRSEGGSGRSSTTPAGMDLRAAFRASLPVPGWPSSSSAQVQVALFDLGDWAPWLADAVALLDAADLERAQRRRSACDRDVLTMSYALHRLLIGARMGVDAVAVPLVRDALGCPRLRDTRISTSLSHAEHSLALAVTAAGPVGVDIEPVDQVRVMPEIAGRVSHPSEVAHLADALPADSARALLELWVRKEALLKAAGVGMAREMSTFVAPANEPLVLSPPDPELTQLQMLDIGEDWVGAVAAPPGSSVESRWLRPPAAPAT